MDVMMRDLKKIWEEIIDYDEEMSHPEKVDLLFEQYESLLFLLKRMIDFIRVHEEKIKLLENTSGLQELLDNVPEDSEPEFFL